MRKYCYNITPWKKCLWNICNCWNLICFTFVTCLRSNVRFVLLIKQTHKTNKVCTEIFMPPPFEECGRALSVAHARACVFASVRLCVPLFKWVLCERNSSYNFIPILLKLYRCFCQGLKMCTTFGYNPSDKFLSLFSQFELSHFWAQLLQKLMDIRYLVSATPPTILSQSFWNLTGVFVKDGRYALHLDIIFRLIFYNFFTVWT